MAGFTQDDIEELEDSIRKIVNAGPNSGQLIAVTIDNRVEQYNYGKLPDLRALLDQMRAEVSAASTSTTTRRPRAYLMTYNKGL